MRASALAACLALTGAGAAGAGTPHDGMTLAFSSDFRAESPTEGWRTTYGDGSRTHPGELEVYVDPAYLAASGMTDDLDPFSASGGALDVTARYVPSPPPGHPDARYVSGLMTTRGTFSFVHGYAEARMRMPAGPGLWPAFWLLRDGPAYGEVDVVEMLGEYPRDVFQTIHAGSDWESRKVLQTKTVEPSDVTGAFHTFGVDKEADSVTFYVDGVVTGSHPAAPALEAPFHLLLDLAVGGPWSDAPDLRDFPATMTVDYVRVWVPGTPSRGDGRP